jgi:translation initiation factor 1
VGEFFLSKTDAQKILKLLKKKLGCGGSFKDGYMEFQGELKEKIRPLLVELNFRFKSGH